MPVASPVCDIAIIGAGPVGLFAVFECGMLGMRCHLVDALDQVGGQCAALYPEKPIYDIPAHPCITGHELIDRLARQAAVFEPVFHLGQRVEGLEPVETEDGRRWRVTTDRGICLQARAVIIAAGVGAFGPNRPPLAGIEAHEGKGVRYHITRREEFRGQRVVIAGGGDSAVDWALSLAEVAGSVALVHRRGKFRAAPESLRQLDALIQQGRITLVTPYQLHALVGEPGALRAVEVATLQGEIKSLPADVLLPFFGLSMDLGPILEWGLGMSEHHILIDPATAATSAPGVFAIGDIARYPYKLKLILSGFAEAAQAAHAIRPLVFPGQELHFQYSTTSGIPHPPESAGL